MKERLDSTRKAPRRLIATLLSVLLVLLRTTDAKAAKRGLDIAELSARTGVSLLAVTFYSPSRGDARTLERWRDVQAEYAGDGLEVVFVLPGILHGGCEGVDSPWMPEHVICDEFGVIARSFRLADLPETDVPLAVQPRTYLWSWTGKLVGSGEGPDDVLPSLIAEITHKPRVVIEVGEAAEELGGGSVRLSAELRALLVADRKLEPMPSGTSLASYARSSRADPSRASARSFSSSCALEDVADVADVNALDGSVLHVSVDAVGAVDAVAARAARAAVAARGLAPRLKLTLTTDRGCRLAEVHEVWRASAQDVVLAEALRRLVDALRRRPEWPRPAHVVSTREHPFAGGDHDLKTDRQASLSRLSSLSVKGVSAEGLLYYARGVVGARHRECGSPPKSFDAVSLVRHAYATVFGVDLGPTAVGMWRQGIEVPIGRHTAAHGLMPGDLIFLFSNSDAPAWTGLYLGGGLVLGAHPIRGVQITPIPAQDSMLGRLAARRYLRAAFGIAPDTLAIGSRTAAIGSTPGVKAAEPSVEPLEGVGVPPASGWPEDLRHCDPTVSEAP